MLNELNDDRHNNQGGLKAETSSESVSIKRPSESFQTRSSPQRTITVCATFNEEDMTLSRFIDSSSLVFTSSPSSSPSSSSSLLDPSSPISFSPSPLSSKQGHNNKPKKSSANRKSRAGKKSSYKHIPHCLKPPHLVAKRNARERNRVQAVNSAFTRLRKHVPYEPRHKRLSKVKTLRVAIEYIQHLQKLIRHHDQQTTSEQTVMTDMHSQCPPYRSHFHNDRKLSCHNKPTSKPCHSSLHLHPDMDSRCNFPTSLLQSGDPFTFAPGDTSYDCQIFCKDESENVLVNTNFRATSGQSPSLCSMVATIPKPQLEQETSSVTRQRLHSSHCLKNNNNNNSRYVQHSAIMPNPTSFNFPSLSPSLSRPNYRPVVSPTTTVAGTVQDTTCAYNSPFHESSAYQEYNRQNDLSIFQSSLDSSASASSDQEKIVRQPCKMISSGDFVGHTHNKSTLHPALTNTIQDNYYYFKLPLGQNTVSDSPQMPHDYCFLNTEQRIREIQHFAAPLHSKESQNLPLMGTPGDNSLCSYGGFQIQDLNP